MAIEQERANHVPEDFNGTAGFIAEMDRIFHEQEQLGNLQADTAVTPPDRYEDESDTLFIGREFTVDEFARWFGAQRLGSLPYNAVGFHHTYIPTAVQWAGVPTLLGIFRYYNQDLGWTPYGMGPHLFVYSGEGNYRPGQPFVYAATHPASDGYGIVSRNSRWLHIEHIWDGDAQPFSNAFMHLMGKILAIVCSPHPYAARAIPLQFISPGVDSPSAPLGIMFHRDQNPDWDPNVPSQAWPKSCPGLTVTHSNLDGPVLHAAQQHSPWNWTTNGPQEGQIGTVVAGTHAIARDRPSRTEGTIVQQLEAGRKYPVDEETVTGESAFGSPIWYHLTDIGWVHASGGTFSPISTTGSLLAVAGAVARDQPSTQGTVVQYLTAGQRYPVDRVEMNGEDIYATALWYHLTDIGWVHASGGTFSRSLMQ